MQLNEHKTCKTQKVTMVLSPLTTLGQESWLAYSTAPVPHCERDDVSANRLRLLSTSLERHGFNPIQRHTGSHWTTQ